MCEVGRCLLADLLRKADLTQQELADLCLMSKSQISDYTTNRRTMSLRTAKTLVEAINRSTHLTIYIDDLYEWQFNRTSRHGDD